MTEGSSEAQPGTALLQAQAVGVRLLFLMRCWIRVGQRPPSVPCSEDVSAWLLTPPNVQVERVRGSHRVEARRSRDLIMEVTSVVT